MIVYGLAIALTSRRLIGKVAKLAALDFWADGSKVVALEMKKVSEKRNQRKYYSKLGVAG
jgi:nucleoside diphosphate kinase